jgi:hypothetical protein
MQGCGGPKGWRRWKAQIDDDFWFVWRGHRHRLRPGEIR